MSALLWLKNFIVETYSKCAALAMPTFAIGLVTMLAVFVIFAGIPVVEAAINGQINYQGKLTNTSGVAVADGTYEMVFKLYTGPSGGSPIWTETRSGGNEVQVTSGVFSVMLGSVSPLSSVNFNQTLYLGVTIETDAEMSPRKILGAVPAAFQANSLQGTGIIDITNTAASQATVAYDASNKITVGVASNGFTTLTASGSGAGWNLAGGNVGIGTSTVSAKLHTTATTEQLRLAYDAGNFSSFTVSSGGDLTIVPSGGDLGVTGNVDVSGALVAGTANAFSVSTAGAVTAGSWTATAVANQYGGTGINTSSSNGVPSINGGAWQVNAVTQNGVMYGGASNALSFTSQGGTNTVLVANGGAPSFSSAITVGTSVTSPTINASTVLQLAGVDINTAGTLTNVVYKNQANAFTAAQGITVQSPTALSVARTGSNYAFQVDTNTASSATGLKVTSAAAGGGVAVAAISSGTNENLTVDAKGSGTISIGASSTGDVLLAGGSGSTGCTVANSTGNFTCTGTLAGSNFSGSSSGTNTGDQTTSGTSNRIAVTNGSTNPVIDIAATYVGQTSITTLGTISTGVWQGTAVGIGYGGTGTTTSQGAINAISQLTTIGDIIYHNGTNSTRLARGTNGQCLTSNASTILWGTCGGSQTPWTSNINASGFALQNALNIEFQTAAGSAPAGSVVALFQDNSGDLTANVASGKTFNISVNAADEYNFSSTELALNNNNITGLGTTLSAMAGLTISSGAANNITIAPGTTGGLIVQSGSGSLSAFQVNNAAAVSIASINTAIGADANNLIVNPSFEQNAHNWIAKGTPTGSTPLWDNTSGNAKYGNGTMRVSGDAAGDGAQYSFPFKASQAYSVSFWAKTASGTGTLRLDRQDNGSDVGGCANSSVTTTWTEFTCTFTTGGTVNTSTSNIFVKQNTAGTPTFFIDGFVMVESSTVIPYSMPANNIQVDADYSNIILNAGQDADIQPWQMNSWPLPSGRRGAGSVTANGFAYFVGGTTANGTSGAPVTTVNYAQIKADGSISYAAWSTTTVLPVALYGHSTFVANGYIYIVGGCSDSSATAACTTPVSTVYYAKLNSDGTVGTWQTNPNSLPAARGYGDAVFSNGFVFYLGGYNASAQTAAYSGRLNADGAVTGWTTTGVTALGSGRYGHTAINANGKIYTIGGCSDAGALCGTAINTVQYATPTNSGTLGSWTAATSLPIATGFHSTSLLNGHIFNYGGRQGGAPVATVYYAKVNSIGPLGIWDTSSNPLPAARQQSTSLFVNSYIYNMGGFDGTTTLPTSVHYASGARVLLFGGLDLVSLSAQTLTDYAGAGTLTAGNTRVVGDLRIDGFADLNNGLSVDSVLNLNAVSSIVGQNIFNINNLNSNSIFSVRHMNTNFGALASSGAFMSNMSYYGDEFSIHNRNTALTADTAGGVGDNQEMYFDTFTGTATTYSTPANQINGIGRVSYPATSGTGSVIANGKVTAATMDTPFQSANLPVVQMKVRPSANTATNDMIYGLTGTYAASGTNDTLPANGIYFWNNNAAGGWQGVVRSGSSNVGTATCGGSISTAQFATLRIEVLVGTGTGGQVRFAVDNDASDGINFIDCGTVTGTLPAGPFAATISNIHTVAATATVDIDYIRIWQDDSAPDAEASADETLGQEPPLVLEDIAEGFNAKLFLANLMSQTDPDASEVTSQSMAVQQADFERLVATSEIVTPKITASGLFIDSISALDKNIAFLSDTSFIGRPYFNNDTAGFAVIRKGERYVDVEFDDPYLSQPIVNATITANADNYFSDKDLDAVTAEQLQTLQEVRDEAMFMEGYQYLVTNKSVKGFRIFLNKKAAEDIMFSWISLAVKNAKIVISERQVDYGEVSGDFIQIQQSSAEGSNYVEIYGSRENQQNRSEPGNEGAEPSPNETPANNPDSTEEITAGNMAENSE